MIEARSDATLDGPARARARIARRLALSLPLFAALATVASPRPAAALPPYPDDITPGELRGISMNPGDPWTLGYWEYLPTDYESLQPGELLPLLVFLPGIGEYDDVSVCPGNTDFCAAGACGNDGLCRNLTWGPQQHMRVGNWDDSVRPFIFVSPQNDVPPFSTIEFNLLELEAFFQFIVDNYPVDPRRMYLTGMSQGGRAVLQYTNAHPRQFTAVTPLPGGVIFPTEVGCNLQDTALWVFHGEDDNNANLGPGTFSPCWMVQVEHMYQHPDLYPGYAACTNRVGQPHPQGRMSMFYNVGHFAWVQAIDPVGSGFPQQEWASDQGCGIAADFREYSAANDSDGIYSWFLSLDRPDVAAPPDQLVVADGNSVTLTATVLDDDAITWTWTQTAGPLVTMSFADTAALQLDDLVAGGIYSFEVLAVDSDGQWDLDDITITAIDGGGGGSSGGGSTGIIDPTAGGSTGIIDPTAGGSTGIIDPTAGGSTGIIDPSAGGSTGIVDPSAGGSTGIIDPSAGGSTGIIDPSAGGSTGIIDPSTGGSTGVDPSTGSTTGVDPSTGSTGGSDGSTGAVTSDSGTTTASTDGASTSTGSTGSASDSDATTGGSASATGASATGATSAADTSAGESASASASAEGGSATAGAESGTTDAGGSGDTDGVTGELAPGVCGCATDPRDPARGLPWATLLAVVSLRRRRRG